MESDNKSRYPKLEKPVFTPAVPEYLLAKLSESEKYLVESVSKIEAQSKWLLENSLEQNRILLEIDARLSVIEKWRDIILSKWSVFAGIALIIIPAVLSGGIKSLMDKLIGGH